MAELCPCSSVLWEVEVVSDEIRHFSEEILKSSVERVAWFLLAASSKMREKRNESKKERLSKKKP